MKYDLQRSFSSGELSELTHMRNDFGDIYDAGVSILQNMRPDTRGPAISRDALSAYYVLNGPPQPTDARLEVLQGDNYFYVLMFIHIGLIIFRDLSVPSNGELLSAPWTRDQIHDLQLIPLPSGRSVYILHPNVQPYKLTDNTNPPDNQSFISSGTFVVPVGITSVIACVCGGGGGGAVGAYSSDGSQAGGGSGVVKQSMATTPGETLTITVGAGGLGAVKDVDTSGEDGENSTVVSLLETVTSFAGQGAQFNDQGGAGGSLGGDGGGVTGPLASTDGGDTTATCDGSTNTGGIRPNGLAEEGSGGGAGGYGNGANGGLDGQDGVDALPNTGAGGGGGGRLAPGNKQTSGGNGGSGRVDLSWVNPAEGFVLDAVTFTGAPLSWVGTNWPSVGTYFQGRLWLGGEPENPVDFFGSNPGLPEDFTLGVAPAGAIAESIEQIGAIKWMVAVKSLVIGTISSEYVLNSDSKILVPGEISIDRQSSYGSASIQPLIIGDQIIYVSPDRRRIYAMNYEFLKENWLSVDLTFFSNHITESGIKEITWSQYPNKTIFVTLNNGKFCTLSYERGNDVSGWSSNDTQGKITSITSGFNGLKDITVFALERVPGEGDIHIEYLSPDQNMDSFKTVYEYTVYGDIFYIEGFIHLEGRTVQILIDDIVHPERVVGAESELGAADEFPGRIYLNFVGSAHTAGLKYIPKLISLPSNKEFSEGNDFMHEKTYSEIAVKILNSRRPIVNGMDTYQRFPDTPQGEPEPPRTELLLIGNDGWDQDAFIEISQPLPYKLTIAAIGGQYTSKKL